MNQERIDKLFSAMLKSNNWSVCSDLIEKCSYTIWVNKNKDEWKLDGGKAKACGQFQFQTLDKNNIIYSYMKGLSCHRTSGSALSYYDADNFKCYAYYLDGVAHNIKRPNTGYSVNGNLAFKMWYINGKMGRVEGPANEWWRKDGSPLYTRYMLDGKYHRLDGPAVIHHEQDYENKERYYIDGIPYEDIREFERVRDQYLIMNKLTEQMNAS